MPATPAAGGGGRGVDGGEGEGRAIGDFDAAGKRDDDVPEMDIDASDLAAYWRRADQKGTAKDRAMVTKAVARTSSSRTRRRSCSACTSAARGDAG